MKKICKLVKKPVYYLLAALVLLGVVFWFTTYHPKEVQEEPFYNSPDSPVLKSGQKIKVMSWNIQFMAGKNYIFIYDVRDESESPHNRPESKDIKLTLQEVARVIIDENPDIVLLQEVDDGAKRTDYQDQLKALMALLPAEYCNHASAYYWKSKFVPHPRILGSVGMKLSTLSKYQISGATRYQLPLIPYNFFVQNYAFKRALLETRFPVEGHQKPLVTLNVHADAFAQGYDTMKQQIALIDNKLESYDSQDQCWCIGGDFNLLPPGQRSYLDDYFQLEYEEYSEIARLLEKYHAIPHLEDLVPENQYKWFTHFTNDPRAKGLDRTLDYIFHSRALKQVDRYVRQHDTLVISDHLPIIGIFEIN